MNDDTYINTIAQQSAQATNILGRQPHRPAPIILIKSNTWNSTAMGFGGIGGAAMTDGYVGVYGVGRYIIVFHGIHFAYMLDVKNHVGVLSDIEKVPDIKDVEDIFSNRCEIICFKIKEAKDYVDYIRSIKKM